MKVSVSSSPTLAELNARGLTSHSKRPASAPVGGELATHITPVYASVGDSCTMNDKSPTVGFVEKDATFDSLSASFKSLYNSLFTQSVGSHRNEDFPNPSLTLTPSSSTDSISLHNSSSPPQFASYSKPYDPQFTTLMDGLKDLADSNHWERLSPSQIQNLRESFHNGGHERFGMDPDSYAELSLSFSQFLTQLDGHLLPPATSSSGISGEFLSSPAHGHVPARLPPPSYSPYSCREHHNISPPITAIPTLGPSLVTQPHPYNTSFSAYLPPLHDHSPSLATTASTGGQPQHTEQIPSFKSAATDLFEDNDEDDDFDWSKFM